VRRGHVAQLQVLALAVVAFALAAPPAIAWAHIDVVPRESVAGTTERYGIRVPSEKPIATVRVEVQFPAAVRVLDFEAAAGWQLTTQTDGSGRPVDAVWQGGVIGPNQYAEFGLRAQNPAQPTDLRWTVIQTYEDGSEVQWVGPPTAQFPAASTRVRDAGWLATIDPLAGLAVGMGLVALALSFVALLTRARGKTVI
jgi:uncharacterized protein YcnI